MKGRYYPKNRDKYKGDPTNIVYRSQYELTYMRWCDTQPNVLEWSSEEVIVKYRSILDEENERKKNIRTKRWHRYYVDFYIKVKKKDGSTQKYLIEVKPYHETVAPIFEGTKKTERTKAMQLKTWIVNNAKWRAAEEYCKQRGMIFKKVTEGDLYGHKK